MFTITQLQRALAKQRPDAKLRTLTVNATQHGLELVGYTDEGSSFRVLAAPEEPPAKTKPAKPK